MRVCYFGTYERDYPRNRVMIQALQAVGIEVAECHRPLWEKTRHKFGKFLSPLSLLRLAFQALWVYLRLTARYFSIGPSDAVIVGYIGQLDMILAWLLTRLPRRRLLFNPMVSIYETLIEDRRERSERSLLGRLSRWADWIACRLSDGVILDTDQNIQYFCRMFGLPRERFHRVFIGADERHFRPIRRTKSDATFQVLFYGKLIPLHGIETVLGAAHLLRSQPMIRFEVIGSGQLSDSVAAQARRLGLQNVRFVDWVDYEKLQERIAQSDLCLGIFSGGPKAGRVIPNKVYQALAMAKPVLTRDSDAIRELFPDGKGIYLVPPADPQALADAILRIFREPTKAAETAEHGYRVFTTGAGTRVLGQEFLRIAAFVSKTAAETAS